MRELNERADVDLKLSQMGMIHDPEQLSERYGTQLEARQVATIPQVENKLKNLMPK
jgi:hypothetical protein